MKKDVGSSRLRFSFPAAFAVVLLCLFSLAACAAPTPEMYSANTLAMDTLVTQDAYGASAKDAMREVNLALARWEEQMTRFGGEGDIARVNAAAGTGPVEVRAETAILLQQALALSAQSEGAFAITVGPLTGAWGVTTDAPRVPEEAEIAALLPLVDDEAVEVSGSHVGLPAAGMELDLGGIAKGAACEIALGIYEEYGVGSALLSIGGSTILAHGTKPGGECWRVAFKDPLRAETAYIASFALEDAAMATSGGYERFFEAEGRRYIHIIDPRTGHPAESDILQVGVVCPTGTEADFWSTTLFVWGMERTLDYMENGGCAIVLDSENNLYISESLQDSFLLHVDEGAYTITFVAGG